HRAQPGRHRAAGGHDLPLPPAAARGVGSGRLRPPRPRAQHPRARDRASFRPVRRRDGGARSRGRGRRQKARLTMAIPKPLPPEKLFRVCDPAALGFKTTADLPDLEELLGQPRAAEAMRFGIDIRHQGYNIFVLGPQGAGRYTLIGEFLRRAAAAEKRPDDWCYVFNFDEPHKPKALRLPPGMGLPFRQTMAQLVEDLRAAIPAAFEAEEHQARQALRQEAQQKGLALGQSPTGFVFVPMKHGKAIPPEVFNALESKERE